MRKLRMLSVLVAAVALSACASGPTERVIPSDGSASAFVLNRSEISFTVYVVGSTGRYRLGFVDALRSSNFRIPGEMVASGGAFRMLAEGRGAHGDIGSETFQLQPGYIVNWRIPDNNLSVR